MTKRVVFAGMILLALAVAALAADAITGKWVMSQDFNGMTITTTFEFKVDGAKLTGTALTTGAPQDSPAAPISNGKIDGDKVAFDVVRDFGGQSMTMKYEGTVSGSELKLKINFPGFGGGEPMSFDGTAKKSN